MPNGSPVRLKHLLAKLKIANRRFRRRCPFSDKGFTLIEILVSISVLSIAMVVILQLFSGGLGSSRTCEAYTKGIFHAREKMEEILLGTELSEEVSEGEFEDGYRWRSEILREAQSEKEAAKFPFELYHIRVDIFWDEGTKEKSFNINTMKLVEKWKDGQTPINTGK